MTASRDSSSLYIPSLDGIRAAAVLLVFAAHAGLNERVPGNFGVTVFFFLSGYLITTLLRIEAERTGRVSLKDFYLRRVLRILPPMYLVLATASLLTLTGALEGSLTPEGLVAQAVHLSNYYIVDHGWWEGRAPGTWIYWSLAVEEHFYLAFPLLYLGLRRWLSPRAQMLALLALCGGVLLWRLLLVFGFDAPKDRLYVATDTRVDSILFGCALAVYGNPVLDRLRVGELWWKFVWLPLALGGLMFTFLVRNPQFEQTVRYTLQGICLYPVFVVGIRFPNWIVMRWLNFGWVKFVGVLSYSLYLLHPTVLFGISQWTSWHPLAQGIAGLGLSLMLAVAIYLAVERPCAALRKRLSRAGASPAARRAERVSATSHLLHERTPPRMFVSAVICTRNRPDFIGQAVESVLANTYSNFDLLVVDQSTDDRTGDIIRALMARHVNLRYLHTDRAGLSRAYNIGIRESVGDILAFTDDDCVAPSDWIASIVHAFDVRPEVDMLYGQVLLPAALEGATGEVPTLRIERPELMSREHGFRVYGMGANYAARRSLLERVGGFDEALGGGGPLKSSQDFDLQYRAYLAGAVVMLWPEARVDHYGLRTREQWPATLVAYGCGDGAFYFKHVRCGDAFALAMLLKRVGRLLVREVLSSIGLRRRPSNAVYLRSYLTGIRQSMRFPVDRNRRMYVSGQSS